MPHFYNVLHRRHGKPRDGMTRREMLQATLAASAGLLVSNIVAVRPEQAGQAHRRHRRRLQRAWPPRTSSSAAGYDVTVLEARNRVGGRVITFTDFVPGKHVEGGGELIGSNHPTWVAYADKFKLAFLDVTEERSRVPDRARRQAPARAKSPRSCGRRWTPTVNAMNADAAKVHRRVSAVDDAATPSRSTSERWPSGLRGCRRLAAVQGGHRRADERRQRRARRVAELSRQPRHGEGRRPREVLERQRGVSLRGRQSVARDAPARRPSGPTRVCSGRPSGAST